MSEILFLLYLYIAIFTLYFLVLAITSMCPARKIRDKFTSKDSNLCVVVYATGKCDTLENLIKQLKNQNYPKQCYTIYAILDKCENVSEVTLQTELNVNVVNINNIEPVGKSQAYSIIAEKLQDIKDLDAYVFLDAKNYIEQDFLANVNFYLTKYDVFNPMINYLPQSDSLTFWENVKSAYSRYISSFISKSRTRLGFTNIINTDSFIIKKDLLNKIASFDFRDLISEVEYTLKLARKGVKVAFLDDLRVYESIENFDYRIPSLSKRFGIFWNNIFKSETWTAREFALSLITPNCLTLVIGYFMILDHICRFSMFVNYSNVLLTGLTLLLAFSISLTNVKLTSKEYLYLLMYPISAIGRVVYNIPFFRGIRSLIKNTTRKHDIQEMVVDVFVSDGQNDFPCKMKLISDDGAAKVTFINNKKTYTTKNNHLRMIDAVRELSTKLADYGLTLKVCQCCKYFQPVVDGTTNMVKGQCNCQFQGRTPGDIIPTLIWNTCPKFEEHNIVNLF